MRRGLFAFLLALAAASPALAEASDDADIERAGCRVRTSEIDAQGRARVEAHCEWSVAPDAVLALLRDPAAMEAALSTLAECRALGGGRVLQVHSMGWPLDDRQVVLDWRERALADGGVRFDYALSAQQEPLGEGRVQILADDGFWEIRGDGSGGTRLAYSSRYDAGGNLKPFVVRRFQKDGIASSLEELLAAARAKH
jgi:carbon monoxide dehydrogenase subunit G